MRGKAKCKVDDYCQDDRADDSLWRGAKVDSNCCNGARRKHVNTNDYGGLCHGPVLISKANFMPWATAIGRIKGDNLRKRVE
jgi:hypothetical protein